MQRSDQTLGLALGLLGVIIFGGSLPATRLAVSGGLDPLFMTAARAALAGLAAVAVLVVMRRRPPWPHFRLLFVAMLCLAILFPGLAAFALTTVPAAHGGVILALLPLATAAAAFAFAGERPSLKFWLFAVLGSALVVAFALRDGIVVVTGDAYLFLVVIVGGVGYAVSGRLAREMPGWEVISWALVICLPVSLPAAVLLWPHDIDAVETSAWLGLAYSAMMVQYVGFWAWNAGLAIGGVARVGQVQLLQPFVTFVLAAIFLSERIDIVMVGFAIAVVTVVALGRRAAVGVRAS